MNNTPTLDQIEGILLGTAVADSLGLPMECLNALTIQKLGWDQNMQHHFFLGKGMWSDDTEHMIMLAQSLLASDQDIDKFIRKFGWELRSWLWGLPAGVGLGTARALVKLSLGFSAKNSGVFSAGNGAAMRTAIIAAYFPNDQARRIAYTSAQTRVTHSDPKATIASIAVTEVTAVLLRSSVHPTVKTVLEILRNNTVELDSEWLEIVDTLELAWSENHSIEDFLSLLGCNPKKGISGYVYQTVPTVLFIGVRHQWNYAHAVPSIIAQGGDTDTTAAILGAMCGAYGGRSSIPKEWIDTIAEWPTTAKDLCALAHAVKNKNPRRIRPYWSPIQLLRNLIFLAIVLVHGFSRLLFFRFIDVRPKTVGNSPK